MTPRRIVIVGASLAGATAAVTLREEGFDGEIHLLGAERELPYNRPPLSKTYLRGEEGFDAQLVKPAAYYAEQRIELRLGAPATSIDTSGKTVDLGSGARVPYDQLLVTTGSRNRTLSVPGANLDNVFQLRTVQECDRIRAVIPKSRRAVVIGFGFIGCEVSASLRQLGVEVAVVEGARVPLARVLGDEVGQVLAEIHRDKGVELVLEDSVAALEGNARVERVRTTKGRVLECDMVVAGIGIVPNTELLGAAGAAVDNGVLVDGHCRTSLPDVFAAGDVTNHLHPIFGRLRVEHWNNGQRQGQAAARAMLGGAAPYDYIHSFWSDQYEHLIEYVGFAKRWDRVVFRGRPESRKFLGFFLEGGIIRAAVGLDRGGDPEDSKGGELKEAVQLIRDGVAVDPEKLADESVSMVDSAQRP
ncbi:MAG TPA: FAD-dependent oxidoreductase [Candidatus Limnocylindrales bacterium]|nr:FAD-dependent oxidoreductase [Candidatus Limnocylindrales bacterium]